YLREHRKSADDTEAKLKVYALPRLGEKRVADLTAADFDEWMTWALRRRRQRSPKTAAKVAAKAAAKPEVAEVEPAERQRRRKSTLNRVINSLKACLNHARASGKVPSAEAWSRLQKFRAVDSARLRWLSEDEATRLQNA